MSPASDPPQDPDAAERPVTGSSDDVSARVAELRSEITEHNRRYHEDDAPTISDADFDALVRELRGYEEQFPELITPDSPTQQVGAPRSTQFAPVQHREPRRRPDRNRRPRSSRRPSPERPMRFPGPRRRCKPPPRWQKWKWRAGFASPSTAPPPT